MISVCLATYNGEKYIADQLRSILSQLSLEDEVIISDDGSIDSTLAIINSFNDKRITVIKHEHDNSNVISNFENAINHAAGNYIFLSDQDDIWLPNKVKIMMSYFAKYDVVISNCSIVDKDLNIIKKTFFPINSNRKGLLKNIYKNHYLGCCMAFKRKVVSIILPFPYKIAMHDIWIGLCAEAFFNAIFIDDVLLLYRRHGDNASPTSEESQISFVRKISYRVYFLIQLLLRLFYVWRKNINEK